MKSDSDFFHSGNSGKWHGKLTDEELAAYDAMMDAHLSPEDRAWLEYGAEARAPALKGRPSDGRLRTKT